MHALPIMQIQTEIGEGHANLIDVYQLILTPTHLALCMEWASGGSLTSYVADKWQHADPAGLVMSEDEARYFFKVLCRAVLDTAILCCCMLCCAISCAVVLHGAVLFPTVLC